MPWLRQWAIAAADRLSQLEGSGGVFAGLINSVLVDGTEGGESPAPQLIGGLESICGGAAVPCQEAGKPARRDREPRVSQNFPG